MRGELWVLLLSICLGILQILMSAAAATKVRGLAWNLSSRNTPTEPLEGRAGRIDRALQNFKETFPFFAAAILMVGVTDHYGDLSLAGAWIYLFCRIIYVPIYAFDVIGFRTTVWSFSLLGIILVLSQMLISTPGF